MPVPRREVIPMVINGIDISDHNTWTMPDFKKVKAAGNDFVIVRIGWAGYAGEIHEDDRARKAIEAALAAGLNVGLYVYTYATSVAAARKAAKEAVEFAKGFYITYPIVYDIEEVDKVKYPEFVNLSKAEKTATVAAFCDEVEHLGYYAMYYTYTSYALTYLDTSKLSKYDFWVADYRNSQKCMYNGKYGMWQWIGDNGRVNGIVGACDRNYAYKDYAEIIKRAKLNNTGKIQEPAVKAEEVAFNVGDRVKIVGTRYATGQTIPSWVKKSSYSIRSVDNIKKWVLISGILSWVAFDDVVKE